MERFIGTAVLDEAHARDLGVVGIAGRASGLAFDARDATRRCPCRAGSPPPFVSTVM